MADIVQASSLAHHATVGVTGMHVHKQFLARLSLVAVECMFRVQVNVNYSRCFELLFYARKLQMSETTGRYAIIRMESTGVRTLEAQLDAWISHYTNLTCAEAAVVEKSVELVRCNWIGRQGILAPWQEFLLHQVGECVRLARMYRRFGTLEMQYLRSHLDYATEHPFTEFRVRLKKCARKNNICPLWLMEDKGCRKERCGAIHPAVDWVL